MSIEELKKLIIESSDIISISEYYKELLEEGISYENLDMAIMYEEKIIKEYYKRYSDTFMRKPVTFTKYLGNILVHSIALQKAHERFIQSQTEKEEKSLINTFENTILD